MLSDPHVWYRDKSVLRMGDVTRYTFNYAPVNKDKKKVYIRLKNIEKAPIRAIHLLNGPFILYCDVIPYKYDHNVKFEPENPEENTEVVFENQIKPGQTFNVELLLNSNSFLCTDDNGNDVYQWTVNVVSQIFISTRSQIHYDFLIGDDQKSLKRLNHGPFSNTITMMSKETSANRKDSLNIPLNESLSPQLSVAKKSTKDLWLHLTTDVNKPIHLIIITHGIFSNVTADMLYIKESLEQSVDDNIMIRGYTKNANKSEKGIARLGTGLHKYIIELLQDAKASGLHINKISFIGHSLGGLVQLYAIKSILEEKGSDFFKKQNIKPIHLICMATPLLGVLSELSLYISWFLDLGTLGQTGRDLTLLRRFPGISFLFRQKGSRRHAFTPLLVTLPDDPLRSFLKEFQHLTVYANAINDGIVPLRTSSLLYLDYEALGNVSHLKEKEAQDKEEGSLDAENGSPSAVGEVPVYKNENVNSNKKAIKESKDYMKTIWNVFGNNTPDKKRIRARQKVLKKISIKGTNHRNQYYEYASKPSTERVSGETKNEDFPVFSLPPKASAIESAINSLLCPIPSQDFILDPEKRPSTILHDQFYNGDRIPAREVPSKNIFKRFFFMLFHHAEWKLAKQDTIARKYHMDNLTWRKVLVTLPPDAHNNIVVRRTFANGYGWGVIDHLCKEVFKS